MVTITPESEVKLSAFQEELGVEEIKITVTEKAQNVKVTVKKYDSKPAEVTVEKTGKVNKYLQIETENLGNKLSKAVLTVKVEKSWSSDNSVDKADIVVSKFDETAEKWNELSTLYKEEDDTYYYYEVQLTSFSYFAIGEKALEGGVLRKEDEEKYLQLLDLREYLRRRVLHLQHVHDLEKIRQNLKDRGTDLDHTLTELNLHLMALASQDSMLLEPMLPSNAEDEITFQANQEVEEALRSTPEEKIKLLEKNDPGVEDVELEEKKEQKL